MRITVALISPSALSAVCAMLIALSVFRSATV